MSTPASLLRFLPAVLALAADGASAAFVRVHQPDYPDVLVVFQIVMVGAALLTAVPTTWLRFTGFFLLVAGVFLSGMSVGVFYVPALFAAFWLVFRETPGQKHV